MAFGRKTLLLLLVFCGASLALAAGATPGAADGAGQSPYTLVQSPPRTVAPALRQQMVDAWHAGNEFADAATVFYPDDRVPITDTTVAPWRDVVYLFIKLGDSYQSCSGSMLSPNVVLTAGHCLFDGGIYAEGALVIPGSAGGYEPYGDTFSANFAVPVGWAEGVGQYPTDSLVPPSRYDFGIVVLNGAPFGNALAPYFTIANVSDAYLAHPSTYLATAGFPADKPDGSMWFTASDQFNFDDTYICTTMDVYPGQSGSPILAYDPDAQQFPYVFSVVSVGNSQCNISVRFTDSVISALEHWCVEDGCTIQSVHLADIPANVASTSTPSPTATPSPTSASTPTPAATSTPAPARTAAPTPAHTHTVTLGPGLNVIAGPVAADLSPAQFASCLPSSAWTALYTWDPAQQQWRHWFGPGVPAYVNDGPNAITQITRGAGVAILLPANAASIAATLPDDAGGVCN